MTSASMHSSSAHPAPPSNTTGHRRSTLGTTRQIGPFTHDAQLESRGYKRQSTAYVDRPDIPVQCSPLCQKSYLREMQHSLTPYGTRNSPTMRVGKQSLVSENRSYSLNAAFPPDHKFRSQGEEKSSLGPVSKVSTYPQPASPVRPVVQPTSLQLALYGSFSSFPRRAKKVSTSTLPPAPASPQLTKQRRRRETVAASHDVVLRLSLPCRAGCCYCVYASLLGPVRVSFSKGDPPSKGRYLAGIRDGNGRAAIPTSRKADIRGLVYDPHSHSLHPPGLGERPMFRLPGHMRRDEGRPSTSVPHDRTDAKRTHGLDKASQPPETSTYRKRKVAIAASADVKSRRSVA